MRPSNALAPNEKEDLNIFSVIALFENRELYQIQFIGCDKTDAETRVLKEVTGNTASFELSTELLFVRAKIISDKEPLNPIENMAHQTAWTQPVQYSN